MALSDAVTLEKVSRIVGYKLTKGNFNLSSPNLPQRIAILGEANDANQSTLSLTPVQVTSAQQAGTLYGYGSPIYHIMRILRPLLSGDGVGGIPTYVYPQAAAPAASAKIMTLTASGVANGSGTHYVKIAGRESQDGVFYAINLASQDNAGTIATKIANAVNAVIGSPVLANATGYEVIFTSKWKGLSADEITISMDTGNNTLGLTYSVVNVQNGAGIPSISAALALFQNDWNTIVVNPYNDTNTMSVLEAFNGIPSPDGVQDPTGRYAGIIMKPFIAITGSTADDPSSVTDARLNNVTIAIAPAPSSTGFSFEAAANMTYLFAIQAQNNPHLDVAGSLYPDMPAPTSINTMATYTNRDAIVKKGCSTVNLSAGVYKVEDFVTTYHPVGENPPQYRYCRNLNIDFNVKYGYHLLEITNVEGHAIASDTDVTSAPNVIRPLDWKSIVDGYATDLANRSLITQPSFMQASIAVQLSTNNPDRLETFFRYKRTGYARILSTTAQAGFNFGTN
jgi:phage tail sheath gpL-like